MRLFAIANEFDWYRLYEPYYFCCCVLERFPTGYFHTATSELILLTAISFELIAPTLRLLRPAHVTCAKRLQVWLQPSLCCCSKTHFVAGGAWTTANCSKHKPKIQKAKFNKTHKSLPFVVVPAMCVCATLRVWPTSAQLTERAWHPLIHAPRPLAGRLVCRTFVTTTTTSAKTTCSSRCNGCVKGSGMWLEYFSRVSTHTHARACERRREYNTTCALFHPQKPILLS